MASATPKKPANQGSAAKSAPTQAPKTSGTPSLDRSAPLVSQDKRGYRTPGVGGSKKS